jgi:ribonuclease HI
MSKVYAVARGRTVGLFRSWPEAETAVKGFSGAVYKAFANDVDAQTFIDAHHAPSSAATAAPATAAAKKRARGSEVSTSEPLTQPARQQPPPAVARSRIAAALPARRTFGNFEFGDARIWPGVPCFAVYADGASRANGTKAALAGFGVFYGDRSTDNVCLPVPKGMPQTNNVAETLACVYTVERQLERDAEAWDRLTTTDSPLPVTPPPTVIIRTDSKYVINAMTAWIEGWRRNGFKTKAGQPVKNLDLMLRLHGATEQRAALRRRYVETFGQLPEAQQTAAVPDDALRTCLASLAVAPDALADFAATATVFSHVKGHSGDAGNEAADRLAVAGALKHRSPEP